MGHLVWELRRVVFRSGTFAIRFLVDFFEVCSASLRLIGGAFVSKVILGAANHAKVVLAATFLLFREELPVRPEDFG